MKCPIDRGELNLYEQKGIAFHFCGDCHGMFFNKENLLGCLRLGKVSTEYSAAPRVTSDVTAKVIRRECPACHAATMYDKLLDEIAIDICPECKSVWLDAGELDKIVERHRRKHGTTGKGGEDYDAVIEASCDGAEGLVGDSDFMGDVASAVGDFLSDADGWLEDAGSSVGEFFTIDL